MSTNLLSDAHDHGADRGPGLWQRTYDNGQSVLTNVRIAGTRRDRSGAWLRVAMVALAVLALTAAIVSYQAQYQLIYAYKGVRLIAALQAAIPDAAALVFASLGIALALTGKRAIRARVLNVAAVGTSIVMNALAATGGWKALAIWTLAPIAYAVTSDTLIGVLRSWTVARHRELNADLADDDSTPLAVVGRAMLYVLRFVLAPPSTARGLRMAILEATPLPEPEAIETEGPKAVEGPNPRQRKPRSHRASQGRKTGAPGKTAQFLDLVTREVAPLAELPLDRVSRVCSEYAPKVGLDAGAARTALRKAVLEAQGGES